MLSTRQPVLRRFWYPAMPSAMVDAGPQPFTLLGKRLVLWRDGDGRYAAMEDRCCHRSAALSKGWVDGNCIVCPYHGWSYDGAGTCVKIPQRPDSAGLKGSAVKSFFCEVRYGHVWVALEAPLAPIPDWPEETDPGYRRIDQFYEPWDCAGFRLMENSFDNAHIHFVHRNTFGDINNPDPPEPTIERLEYGFVARSDVPVYNNEEQKKNLRDDSGFTIRHITAHWYMCSAPPSHPLSQRPRSHHYRRDADRRRPLADRAVLFPHDCEAEAPAAGIIAFDRRVTAEDKEALEGTDYVCRSTCIPASSATCRPTSRAC